MCSSSGMLLNTVVDNSVLLMRIQKRFVKKERICHLIYTKLAHFSDGKVSHIPIYCVVRENVFESKVSGICCSENGIVYLSDSGSNRIYRVGSST